MTPFLVDLAERAVATYVEVVIPLVTVAVIQDRSLWLPVALSGVPATLSVVKSLIAKRFGSSDTASLVA